MFQKSTADRARDARIDSLMRACKTALDNCKSQQTMGVPVDHEEMMLYRSIGLALKALIGADAATFSANAHILHDSIDNITGANGGTPSPGGAPFNYSSADIDKLTGHAMSVAGQLIAQGAPPKVATEAATQVLNKLIQSGVDPNDIAAIRAGVISHAQMLQAGMTPQSPQEQKTAADLFDQAMNNFDSRSRNPFEF